MDEKLYKFFYQNVHNFIDKSEGSLSFTMMFTFFSKNNFLEEKSWEFRKDRP